ncbi:MAG: tRNA (cytidine(34)-2'-O)-methyltransferase [Kiritimatiellae bacterium]|nr:tRNA (cytidine(34)-2'-O)-methyltransferase [Kiritimatiellia bacterium]
MPFHWPDPPLQIVLVEPEIPPNTGNVARLCAATGSALHLIEPLGFKITDRHLRRAGLDYWPFVDLHRHSGWNEWLRDAAPARRWLFSTGGAQSVYDVEFQPGDALVFGCESRGLSDEQLAAHPGRVVGIPLRRAAVRSLNLSGAVSIALYEALRQLHTIAVRHDGRKEEE